MPKIQSFTCYLLIGPETLTPDQQMALEPFTVLKTTKDLIVTECSPWQSEVASLSVRTRNVLENNGVRSWQDLTSHTWPELYRWRNFGHKSAREVELMLDRNGMHLKAVKS